MTLQWQNFNVQCMQLKKGLADSPSLLLHILERLHSAGSHLNGGLVSRSTSSS